MPESFATWGRAPLRGAERQGPPLPSFETNGREVREPGSCCNLLQILRSRCPDAALFLRAVGYEDAFVLKNCTHGLLWCCCLISFMFSMLWLTDVLTLSCSKTIFPTSLLEGS